MNKTAATSLAAAIGIVATLAGCQSSEWKPPPPAPPDAYSIKVEYLEPVRYLFGGEPAFGNQYLHFDPKLNPDSTMLAVGRKACADLHARKPGEVFDGLVKEGWTRFEADAIVGLASKPGALCPDEYKTVDAWRVANPSDRPSSMNN